MGWANSTRRLWANALFLTNVATSPIAGMLPSGTRSALPRPVRRLSEPTRIGTFLLSDDPCDPRRTYAFPVSFPETQGSMTVEQAQNGSALVADNRAIVRQPSSPVADLAARCEDKCLYNSVSCSKRISRHGCRNPLIDYDSHVIWMVRSNADLEDCVLHRRMFTVLSFNDVLDATDNLRGVLAPACERPRSLFGQVVSARGPSDCDDDGRRLNDVANGHSWRILQPVISRLDDVCNARLVGRASRRRWNCQQHKQEGNGNGPVHTNRDLFPLKRPLPERSCYVGCDSPWPHA